MVTAQHIYFGSWTQKNKILCLHDFFSEIEKSVENAFWISKSKLITW